MKTLIKKILGIHSIEEKLRVAEAEATYLKSLLNERYETEWKVRKDGKARYRKVATKVLVNAWHTESEPIDY
jgi:hypothetical protein